MKTDPLDEYYIICFIKLQDIQTFLREVGFEIAGKIGM